MKRLVKAAHSDARDTFKFWVRSSKPSHGEVFDSMRISSAKFKYLLRKCRREKATIRADILASDLSNNDSALFWKHVSKQNNGSLKLADTVGGATGHAAVASMWNGHYSQLFNCVKGDRHKSDVLDAINLFSGECDMFNQDSLSAEHLLDASPGIHTLLAML